MPKMKYHSKKLKYWVHYCSDGFKGKILIKKIKEETITGRFKVVKKIKFCTFCGEEWPMQL